MLDIGTAVRNTKETATWGELPEGLAVVVKIKEGDCELAYLVRKDNPPGPAVKQWATWSAEDTYEAG